MVWSSLLNISHNSQSDFVKQLLHTPRYEKILAEQDKKFEDQIITKDESFRNNDSSSLLTNIKTLDNAIKEAEEKNANKLAP